MRKARHKRTFGPARPKYIHDLRPMVWAALTLTAYLVAFVVSSVLGTPGPLPFVYGGLAMVCILAVEAGLRGRLWIFEPAYSKSFGHPKVAHRLAYFTFALLLALETSIIAGFFLLD